MNLKKHERDFLKLFAQMKSQNKKLSCVKFTSKETI